MYLNKVTIQSPAGDSENRRNEGAFNPEEANGPSMSRLGAKGFLAATRWERLPCSFVNALENKKSFETTLRLNSY
jgi:hypothetical protein